MNAVAMKIEDEVEDEIYDKCKSLNEARDAIIKAIKIIYNPNLFIAMQDEKVALKDIVVKMSDALTSLERLMGHTGNLWERY